MSKLVPWPSPVEPYGDDYLSWKKWTGGQSFGECSVRDSHYFDAELRRTGLNSIRRVLEIGFGNGCFLAYARKRGWKVYGSEASAALVMAANRAGYHAITPAEVATLRDNSFDLIVAFDVFEHIAPEEVPEFLAQLRTKLIPGGAILARFPNGDSPLSMSNQNGDSTHAQAIGTNKLRFFANAAHLEVAHIGPEAYPIRTGSTATTLYRAAIIPVRKLIDAAIKAIYFPGSEVYFTSPNLTAVLRKPAA